MELMGVQIGLNSLSSAGTMDLVEALLGGDSPVTVVMREQSPWLLVLRATTCSVVMGIGSTVMQAPSAEVGIAGGALQREAIVKVVVHDEDHLAAAVRALDGEQLFDDVVPVAEERGLAVYTGQHIALHLRSQRSHLFFVVTDNFLLIGCDSRSQERPKSFLASMDSNFMVWNNFSAVRDGAQYLTAVGSEATLEAGLVLGDPREAAVANKVFICSTFEAVRHQQIVFVTDQARPFQLSCCDSCLFSFLAEGLIQNH